MADQSMDARRTARDQESRVAAAAAVGLNDAWERAWAGAAESAKAPRRCRGRRLG